MSTIFAGNTITTSLVQTGDITGNLVLSSIGNIVLSPGTGYGVVWANNAAFSSGGSGGVTWQPVTTANITAVAGNGYFANTTVANITVTMPSTATAGSYLSFVDYAQTFNTKPLILYPNGLKIQGNTANVTVNTIGQAVNFVYADATKGWINYSTGYILGPYTITYMIVAGGGSGGGDTGQNVGSGGGGAGGVISNTLLVTPTTSYSIVVGGGGSGSTTSAAAGSNSTGFGQTALGGGYGGGTASGSSSFSASSGGSGGGGYGWGSNGGSLSGGSGTAGQGYAGGNGLTPSPYPAGGGGGAGSVGASASGSTAGNGGAGYYFSITGSYYGGGGGGGYGPSGAAGSGGSGGGGAGNGGASTANGTAGTANTGGGGGGAGSNGVGPSSGGSGGSGVVIVAYPGPQRGTGGVVSSAGGYTIHTFNGSSTFTA